MTHTTFVNFLVDLGFARYNAVHYAGRLPRTDTDRARLARTITQDIVERKEYHSAAHTDLRRRNDMPFEKRMSEDSEKAAAGGVTIGGEVPGGYVDNLGFWRDPEMLVSLDAGSLLKKQGRLADDFSDDTHGFVNHTDADDL
jgi:hypothetical protein